MQGFPTASPRRDSLKTKGDIMAESWIRLSVTYPIPDEEDFSGLMFEQELYGLQGRRIQGV